MLLLGAFCVEFADFGQQICTVKAAAPGAGPLVSFKHEGACARRGKPVAKVTGAVAKIVPRVLRAAGFEVVGKEDAASNVTLFYVSNLGRLGETRLEPHQKVSQVPGYSAFTLKDELARNLNAFARRFPEAPQLAPKSYALPEDYGRLLEDARGHRGYYIVKPGASSRGRDIRLVRDAAEVRHDEGAVVQEYLADPLLVDGYKFDLRVYLAVTSVAPLVVYAYPEGLARFATEPFQAPAPENAGHLRMHLTDFAVNSENHQIRQLSGNMTSKWALSDLLKHLDRSSVSAAGEAPSETVTRNVRRVLQLAFLALERDVLARAGAAAETGHFFGLYGADVILDARLNALLLEVNLQPALGTSTQLDFDVKYPLLQDFFNLARIRHGPGAAQGREPVAAQLEEERRRKGRFELLLPAAEPELRRFRTGPDDERAREAWDWAARQ